MGLTLVSGRPTMAVIITILQIRAMISVKATVLAGVEGQRFDFRCEYPQHWANNSKYFSHADVNESPSSLIRAWKHDEWESDGRFAVYDNTSGAFFIVRVDKLEPGDSGVYWCGVNVNNMPDYISTIRLNVSRVQETVTTSMDPHKDKLILPLYLTTVMFVSALLFVCLFTLCLLMVVKNRRSRSVRNRETSCDYEMMMAGVRTQPERCCQCSTECSTDLLASPPDLPPQRDSVLSYGVGDYADVDVHGCLWQYEHLDLSRLENHVYHSLYENNGPKHGPAKETINC